MSKKTDKASTLTHLDAQGRPAMVDVSAKAVTARAATAECRVKFPAGLRRNCTRTG
jgi:cyclic pyranopterin monophosphate synthase